MSSLSKLGASLLVRKINYFVGFYSNLGTVGGIPKLK